MDREFAAELAGLARRLSDDQVANWCTVLEHAPGPLVAVEERLISREPGTEASGAARQLIASWSRHAPLLSGEAVALALSAAATVHDKADHDRARLVASGPVTSAVPVRLTSSVVVDLVRRATGRLLVVSFAAYGVAEVVRQLLAAAHRGVRLDLVVETSTDVGGTLRGPGAAEAFTALRDVASFWHWPAEYRGGSSSLHAKVVVADAASALLGSANLTNRGLADNIEVGVLLRDPDLAGKLDEHFRALMRPEARCLTRLAG
ncbi:DISARM system phospholipase D-like protein DrmC [Saccharothrix deserti]|uniref:DISARM system phospholipase D-like protein DrmC n=1 Tax=Saccharothrix deserti TaxID=2593674 RepID=UPI00131B0F54|nr:DISARM system phospholipase D-like protein DrmC [Saccharothrix deserti]